jgi:hypothetical protein
MAEKEKWVVVGTNSDLQQQVFGMFTKEETAARWARSVERRMPSIQFLAMPITPRNSLERMLDERDYRKDFGYLHPDDPE